MAAGVSPLLVAELRRELSMREQFYPRWIAEGKLTRQTAEFRIACMKQAIELIEPLVKPGPTQMSLLEFDHSSRVVED